MKSIVDTLRAVNDAVTRFKEDTNQTALIALIGGYAALYYGSERTTFDVDTCFYSNNDHPGKSFYAFLKQYLPDRFHLRFMEASKDLDDPFKHDLIIITDEQDEYPRIDIMVVRYKWELEGLEQARMAPRLGFPVIEPLTTPAGVIGNRRAGRIAYHCRNLCIVLSARFFRNTGRDRAERLIRTGYYRSNVTRFPVGEEERHGIRSLLYLRLVLSL